MAATFILPERKLTWLITGCSSGFGLSLTRAVQARGQTVIATSRNPSRTPDLIAEVESKKGKWLQLDVNDPSSGRFVDDLEKSGIGIDVLVNNAGYSIFSPVESTAEEEIRAQMETLYFGPLRLIQAVLPYMRKRKYGVIANFSSGAALDGNPTMGPYAGGKAGLDGMLTFHVPSDIAGGLTEVPHSPFKNLSQRGGSVQHPSLDRHPWHFQHQHGQCRCVQ